MSASHPITTDLVRHNEPALRADFVAEVFCPSECVRLIQDQASMRNVDSRIHSLRFDCCVFLLLPPSLPAPPECRSLQSLPPVDEPVQWPRLAGEIGRAHV